MAMKLINTDKLTAIADAIRGKTGSTDTYSVDGMVNAISNIPSGGGDTSVEDGLIEGTLTASYSNDRVTKVKGGAFQDCSGLTTIDLPVATSVGDQAFFGCSSLTTVSIPLAKRVGNSAFNRCSSLIIVDLPLATNVGSNAFSYSHSLISINLPLARDVGTSTFSNCTSLTAVSLPVATSAGYSVFSNCSSLPVIDLPLVSTIGNTTFDRCYSLTTLILRNTTKVCTLSNTSAFNGCYHYHGTQNSTYNPNGLKDGYIYVPATLINDYKEATNWSTLATQFRALEDYTVDGTTTGELDQSKI